jgi:hypothetical protein
MFGFLWWLIPTCPNRCSTKSPSSAPHGSQFPRSAPGSHALSIRSRPFPQPRHQGVQRHLHMNRGQHDLHIHLPKKELCSGPCTIFFPRFYGAKSEFASCVQRQLKVDWDSRRACHCRKPNNNEYHIAPTFGYLQISDGPSGFPLPSANGQAAQSGCSGSSMLFRGCRCSNLDAA